MTNAFRKLLKIAGITSASLLALICAYLALLIYPGILFANSAEFSNLVIYSEDDLGSIQPILENIDRALIRSEINDRTIQHDIFLGYNNPAFRGLQGVREAILTRLIGRGCGVTCNISWPPHVSHSMTFYQPAIGSDSLVHPDGSARVNQSLSRTLTHEVVHTLITNELGLQRTARTPMWKQEGYADYVAATPSILSNPEYRIRESVERLLDQDLSWLVDNQGNFGRFGYGCQRFGVLTDEEGRRWNTCYYLSRVMVEYLLDVRGLTFRDLMDPATIGPETLTELFSAYEDGSLR